MNKFIINIFAILLFGLALVSAQNISVIPTEAIATGNPGQALFVDHDNNGDTFTVRNDRTSSVSLAVEANNLIGRTDPTKRITASSIAINPSFFSIAPNGGTQRVNITVNIPRGLPAQSYNGTINIKEGQNIVAIFNLTININPVDDIRLVLSSTPLRIISQENEQRNVTFQIVNDGSTQLTLDDLTSFTFSQRSFSDSRRDITLNFNIINENLAPGATTDVNLRATIPNNIEIDTYPGNITVRGGTDTASFILEIQVHPELCENGPVGDLSATIEKPDSGDNFAPGETMRIKVKAENNDIRDISDVIVEAFLFNVDKDEEVERVDSEAVDIDEGDEETFDLDLEIPSDDIEEDDEFILFVKAFEDGDEDRHCGEDQIEVDIEREDHDVSIAEVSLTPSSAETGDIVDVTIKVINLGSKDEDDVTVRIFAPDLGWDQTSSSVNLEDAESRDNDAILRLTFEVPERAQAKTYSIEATVNFDNDRKKNTEFVTFTVLEKTEREEEPTTPQPSEVIRVQSVSETGNNVFTASILLTNPGDKQKTFNIETLAGWALPVGPQIITLGPGDSRSIQIILTGNQGLQTGRYAATISVRENSKLVDSETLSVEVAQEGRVTPTFNIGSLFGGTSSTIVWILVDIVLVIIAIFFIRLIFTAGRSRRVPVKTVTEKVKL